MRRPTLLRYFIYIAIFFFCLQIFIFLFLPSLRNILIGGNRHHSDNPRFNREAVTHARVRTTTLDPDSSNMGVNILQFVSRDLRDEIIRHLAVNTDDDDDDTGYGFLKTIKILDNLMSTSVSNLTSARERDGAILFFGNQQRLEFALLRAISASLQGQKSSSTLNVAVVGGSISANSEKGPTKYFSGLVTWLKNSLQSIGINIDLQNVAIAGIRSEYFSLCLEEFLDLDHVDILLIDLAVDDDLHSDYMPAYKELGRPLEDLIRSIWRRNPLIHIILVNFVHLPKLLQVAGYSKDLDYQDDDIDTIDCGWIDSRQFFDVASHYGIPSVTWKHFFCNSTSRRISWEEKHRILEYNIEQQNSFPRRIAHMQMSEILINVFQKVARQLRKRLKDALKAKGSFHEVKASILSDILASPYPPQTFHVTNWIEHSECFTNFQINARQNKRLQNAVEKMSVIDVRQVTERLYQFDKKNNAMDPKNELEAYQFRPNAFLQSSYIKLRLGDLKADPCRGDGYVPHLALTYFVCTRCDIPAYFDVDAIYNFDDNSSFAISYRLPILFKHLAIVNVQFLMPKSAHFESEPGFRFCQSLQPQLMWIDLTIQQTSSNHLLNLQSVAVAYDCGCKTILGSPSYKDMFVDKMRLQIAEEKQQKKWKEHEVDRRLFYVFLAFCLVSVIGLGYFLYKWCRNKRQKCVKQKDDLWGS